MDVDTLIEGLRADGLRITTARRAICAVLADGEDDHLTAEEIWQRARSGGSVKIDQSTVYRTLDVLERLGFLHHVHLGHGPGVVHVTRKVDHQHLVCEVCGRTVDVPLSEVEEALAGLAGGHGFASLQGTHFAFLGICAECASH